jgi:large subunit ribosomal protein L21|tara:strand:+ start:824 stop:1135 length:312 start_codon:yes stop_codon:yes gene_type:complete
MEAVVRTGGKQYFVQKGDLIETELTQDEIGSEIVFDDVLLLSDSKSMVSDPKVLKSAKVKAKVVSHIKGKKIKVFKFRRRQNSKTLNGHRQKYQVVEIISINK